MKFEFDPRIIIRTPTFPIREFFALSSQEICEVPVFMEALWLASPELAERVRKTYPDIPEGVRESVLKYFNRMCSRPTPFGLFAGCGLVAWQNRTAIICDTGNRRRRTRLDKRLLCRMVEELTQATWFFKHLELQLNNTIYEIGDQIRYFEQSDDDRTTQLSALVRNEFLDRLLLAAQGKGRPSTDYISLCKALGFSSAAAQRYVKQLHAEQLLTSAYRRYVPASTILSNCITKLKAIPHIGHEGRRWLTCLQEVELQLISLDQLESPVPTEQYQKLMESLLAVLPQKPVHQLLQVDQTFVATTGGLDKRLQQKIRLAVKVLERINTVPQESPRLNRFKERFVDRYDRQEIPVLQALDPECGIDYLDHLYIDDFLLAELGLGMRSRSPAPSSSKLNASLFGTWYDQTLRNRSLTMELQQNQLSALDKQPVKLAGTFSAFFKVIANGQLLVHSIGGSSGMNLFTRFTDFDETMAAFAQDIARRDQESDPETIVAEVIHEPFPAAGNVTGYQTFRAYKIPYLSALADGHEGQELLLEDLLVSVRNGRVILRSKSRGRLVKPMISNALNYTKGSALFQFLGDLQHQDGQTLQFDLEAVLPDKQFYPRVSYAGVTFAAARWKLDSEGICNQLELMAWLLDNNIPRYCVLKQGDQELLLDQERGESMWMLFRLLKKRKFVWIREFLLDQQMPVVASPRGETLNHEFVAVMTNDKIVQHQVESMQRHQIGIPDKNRRYGLGTEWLYFKIYGSLASLDRLLTREIPTLIRQLKQRKLLIRWFFIRYCDPEPQLRLRFRLSGQSVLAEVMNAVQTYLGELEVAGRVWKIQAESYTREIERYGDCIQDSERIFHKDSEAVVRLLSFPEFNEQMPLRISLAMRLIADIIDVCYSSVELASRFCGHAKAVLKADIRLTKKQHTSLRTYLRKEGMIYGKQGRHPGASAINRLLEARQQAINKHFGRMAIKCGANTDRLQELVLDHIHMSVNRLFPGSQKIYEYIIHYYLDQYYNRMKHAVSTSGSSLR